MCAEHAREHVGQEIPCTRGEQKRSAGKGAAFSHPESRPAPVRPLASLYFPEETLREIEAEAARLSRSFGWVVRRAVRLALPRIRMFPGRPGVAR